MKSSKRTARIVGALFLLAMVASILGGMLIEAGLGSADYLTNVSANRTQVLIGVLLEITTGIAVIGIAVMMFPLFKTSDEALALGYVALRTVEAVVIVAATISPLTLMTLSQAYASPGAADASLLQTVGTTLLAARAFFVGPLTAIFFCLAALLFFFLLYQTRLLPRFISVWGFIGVALVLAWNLLELFGISISIGMVLALPMILNEIFLAIWLILKGFSPSAPAAQPAA